MRLRPQFQLRFRDAEQLLAIQAMAEKAGVSMNEWLLQKIEAQPVTKGGTQALAE